ncbi:hypothetical protein HYV11_01795 [Candidatus Dependentiae bacterium]|nr:hypothetical protein [Candidatus Dependentiae bacterium]
MFKKTFLSAGFILSFFQLTQASQTPPPQPGQSLQQPLDQKLLYQQAKTNGQNEAKKHRFQGPVGPVKLLVFPAENPKK